jgi:SAM-dependent methyltransferase
VDVVEIDPSVVEFAKKYFGFSTRGEIHVEDARTYLRRSDRRYDVIVHDTFTGGTTPEHLLSVEVIRRIHDLLTPGGVVVLNFPGYDHGENAAGTWAVARTLRSVFPNMRAFRDGPADEEPESPTNIVFFASDGDLEFRIPANTAFENPTCEQIQRSFPSWEIRAKVPDGPVVSDERNPMAALQLPVAEAHFAEMSKLLPREVWLR